MPRQRKPQNSGQRLGTGRVANTTTSTPKLQTVYRIPRWGRCEWDSCGMELEILWTSPIKTTREWETIWHISLDETALKNVIENYESLELDNVTLQTVNGDVTFTGKVTAEGGFEGDLTAGSVTATTADITTATVSDLTATTSSLWTATATSVDTATLAVSWTSTLSWNVTAESDLSVSWNLTAPTGTITTLNSTDATITSLSATSWDITTLTSNDATLWQLSVTGTSSFTGDMSAGNISASGNALLNNLSTSGNATLANVTVNGASTLTGNASVGGNLSVSGNSTVTGNQTVTGDGVFSNDVTVSRDLNVSWDVSVTDDLYVNGRTHLKDVETDWSVDVDGTLRVTWAIDAWNWISVTGQVESDSVVTTNTVTNNLTVNGNIALWNDATAPDFVLQSEKGEPNWVAPLNANGIVPEEHLPPIFTSAIVKVWTWVFTWTNTVDIQDEDITLDSWVKTSNYQDIVWDLDETITNWHLIVTSNQPTETWSFKYAVINPLTACNS